MKGEGGGSGWGCLILSEFCLRFRTGRRRGREVAGGGQRKEDGLGEEEGERERKHSRQRMRKVAKDCLLRLGGGTVDSRRRVLVC